MAASKEGITHTAILSAVRAGQVKPIYFLYGDESYFINQVSDYFEHSFLPEAERSFNLSVVYGRDVTGAQVAGMCRRFPMMSDYQVVLVKEAQNLKDLEPLESYLNQPLDSTVLVLAWKSDKFDKRTRFAKALGQHVVMESKRIYENKIPDFARQYAQQSGIDLDPQAAELLRESVGADLNRLTMELDKLMIGKAKGARISVDEVATQVGIQKEFTIWELQKAVSRRDLGQSLKIMSYYAADSSKGSLFPVVSGMYTFFSRAIIMKTTNQESPQGAKNLFFANVFQAEDLVTVCRSFSLPQLNRALQLLMRLDLQLKGFEATGTPRGMVKQFLAELYR